MSSEEATKPLTVIEKFDILLKDYTVHLEAAKSISARLKLLQKEVAKPVKKRRAQKSASDDSDSDTPRKPSALQKPVKISDELCTFLGFEVGTEHSRQEVTAAINNYVKENQIQDPSNRRFIKLEGSPASTALKKLLRDPDQPLTFFNIQRYLKPHYPMSAKDIKAAEAASVLKPVEPVPTTIVADEAVVDEASKQDPKPVTKRRVVRRA